MKDALLFSCGLAALFAGGVHGLRLPTLRPVRRAGVAPLRAAVADRIARGSLELDARLPPVPNPADTEPFSWTKQWYPVAVVDYLDPEKPHAIQLLGKDLVLWSDGAVPGATSTSTRKMRGKKVREAGTWRAFEDACPHRMAPLSEGRIEETGELLCAYHAWRFDGTGACTAIPQSAPAVVESHMNNPRASCHAFPTCVMDGLLWVWAESGPDAALEALTLRGPNLIPQLHDPKLKGRVKAMSWNKRELPYSWDFFMENVNDPAHVPVSHHGIVGDRYANTNPLVLETTQSVGAQSGYAITVTQVGEKANAVGATTATHAFRPPSLLQITSNFSDGGQLILGLYATPSRPGYTNHIGCQILVRNEAGKLPPGLGLFALPLPIWVLHITASLFLNQDAVFLHHQEQILARGGALGRPGFQAQSGGGEYIKAVFTPNTSDKSIITFRNWLQFHGNGGVPWYGSAELPPRSYDNAKLFDVWDSHTKDCRICQTALKNIRRAKWGAFVASALLVLSRGVVGAIPSALLAAAAAMAGVVLAKVQEMFYRYEFSHADNH